MNNKKNSGLRDVLSILILLALIIGVIYFFVSYGGDTKTFSYTEFETEIEAGHVSEMYVRPAGKNNEGMYVVNGTYSDDDGKSRAYSIIIPTDEKLNDILNLAETQQIKYRVEKISTYSMFNIVFFVILPVVLLLILISSVSRGGAGRANEHLKSRATLTLDKTVKFDKVAGLDEEIEEVRELVDYLKNPNKYVDMGARVPKGILLTGPPGTGKTLLAKAVAGEADVPFYSISGSDFIELYVGVGAGRVRDMFKTAKRSAPAIIFIDEIDTIGKKRGGDMPSGGRDENEQTLNQLLVEMDGFGTNSGIIIMAATNRPDVLDKALMRPGRFDRQVTISAPDVLGREQILAVHAKNKKLDSSVSLKDVASTTPGFTGADLENLLNEATLLAARDKRKSISRHDIDEAVDRVLMGPAKKTRKYTIEEKRTVAYHEAGHAVVGLKLDNSDIVQKVTIIPRGQAGGYALMVPEKEKFLQTKTELEQSIVGLVAGRASEEFFFNEVTTGAHNDFEKATRIARAMVTELGMTDLGITQFESRQQNGFLGFYGTEKNYAEATAIKIDAKVDEILTNAYKQATDLIKKHKELLEKIAHYLLEIETLTKKDIEEIDKTMCLKWWEDRKQSEKKPAEDNIPLGNLVTE